MTPYLPPLTKYVVVRVERKWRRQVEAKTLAARQKHRLARKKEKKAVRLARAEPRRSITPSTDTEDMTSTASRGWTSLRWRVARPTLGTLR